MFDNVQKEKWNKEEHEAITHFILLKKNNIRISRK